MKSFDRLFDPDESGPTFNPATGLPMLGHCGVDIAGNPYGTDWSTHSDPFPSTSMFDAPGCGSSFGRDPWD
ncbi:MAG: hypothetical protein ACYC7G_07385 [Rudaea sp.]